MKTYTLTEEELENLLQERLQAKRYVPGTIFKDVCIDGDRDIQPINQKFERVAGLLNNEKAFHPLRFIFRRKVNIRKSGDKNHYQLADSETHKNLRTLVLNVFGVTRNVDLSEQEAEQAKILYTELKEWFLTSYERRLDVLEK